MSKSNNVYKEAYNRCLRLIGANQTLPSEPELGQTLGVSRTTVRTILTRMAEIGLIEWNKRSKLVLRDPRDDDYFPEGETDTLSQIIERSFMRRLLAENARAGMHINELELAREIGVGTTSVREFLIRFSRFGLIEKRRNSHWVLKGFTREFALELTDIRELFEMRCALAFAQLPADHPAWKALSKIEEEHRVLAASIDTRYRTFSELDERFHRLIVDEANNRFISDFYDVIAMIFHYHYQWNKADERSRNAVAVAEHLDYMAALKSGDREAVEVACRRHLTSARRTLLQSIPDETGAAAKGGQETA